eukprot:TRINITY_DN11581_c0_g1_i10.p2 TRINITY_DN11581_c0_g1~~TRINITY_DN11581_c0_g1_i10.p2  ORF type:complete len:189 (+),score=10.25 TRINITY_DN11581_c0_g1_i10:1079-1645(+)
MDDLRHRSAWKVSADQHDQDAPNIPTGAEVLSSLGLQMVLYFNTLFSPVWLFVVIGASYEDKFPFVFSDIIGLIIYPMLVVLESLRLYMGQRGNLAESTSAITGFVIASGLFELPLLIIVMLRAGMNAFEAIVNAMLGVFLIAGISLGVRALAALNKERSLRFQLLYQGALFDELQDLDDVPAQESRF